MSRLTALISERHNGGDLSTPEKLITDEVGRQKILDNADKVRKPLPAWPWLLVSAIAIIVFLVKYG